MKSLVTALFLAFLALPALAAPLPVVASFSILGDITRSIGGDAVAVTTLVGADSDTHTYQPTPDDAKALTKAQLVIVNGLGFEGWMDRLVKASGTRATLLIASQGIAPRTMVDDGKTITDPHSWQDLANGRIYARNIAAALEAALPNQASAIKQRADAYDAELQKLDADVRAQIASVPAAKRQIITSHDAFGYFGGAYGVIFTAPEGFSTDAEPNAAAIARLHKQIVQTKIKSVFFENMANTRLLQQIAKDTGVTIGGTLYSDALSGPTGKGATYIDMFRNNVPLLVAAMQQNG